MFPPAKGINKENESTEDTIFFIYCNSTDDNIPVMFFASLLIKTVKKTEIDFSFWKIIKYYWLIIISPVKNDKSKQEEIGSVE